MPLTPSAESFRLVQGNGGEVAHTAPSRPLKALEALVGGTRCAGYCAEGIIAFPVERCYGTEKWKWYRDIVHLPQAVPEDFFIHCIGKG